MPFVPLNPQALPARTEGLHSMSLGLGLGLPFRRSAAAAWTPADVPSIVDYGVFDDLTRLKQNSDGTGAVSSVDDPVGFWRGQLDVLTYVQANAANKPKYANDGVYFLSAGTDRLLAADITDKSPADPCALGYRTSDDGGSANFCKFGFSINNTGGVISGRGGAGYDDMRTRNTATQVAAINSLSAGVSIIWSFDGAAASAFVNGTKYNLTVGTSTSTITHITMDGHAATTANAKCKRWAIFSAALSDADAALLTTWLGE